MTCVICGGPTKAPRNRACSHNCGIELRERNRRERVLAGDPVKPHSTHQHRVYGLTCDEFDALIARANGRCELCGSEFVACGTGGHKSGWWIEHCHKTGRVRGLVCPTCNQRVRAVEHGQRIPDEAMLRYLNEGLAA